MKVDLITILKQLLGIYNIPVIILKKLSDQIQLYRELRIQINPELEWEKEIKTFIKNVPLNSINIVKDFMGIQYALFILPQTSECVIIGPYRVGTYEYLETENLINYGFDLGTIQYLNQEILKIPVIDENIVDVQVVSIVSTIYPKDKFEVRHITENTPHNLIPKSLTLSKKKKSVAQTMQDIENRYKIENTLLDAIRLGDISKAMIIFNKMKKPELVERFLHSLRTQKNSLIIMNTLFRKEIEKANVHPFHVDEISARFANEIELVTNENDLMELNDRMIHEYCEYVHRYSLKKYTPPIQKIIHYINLNISNDLSLDEIANVVNMNTSYISDLFKKETGSTISYYIHYQRMRHAAHLLRNTQSSISSIAQSVGIYDVNYFSRLFKRYMGQSPSKYRKQITIK